MTIVDEYGVLQGIVTQTDLLEAIAGDLPDVEDEEPDVIEREDGSLLIDGMMSSQAALDRLGVRMRSADRDFRTVAGFALFQLGHLPEVGEHFRLSRLALRDRGYGRPTHRQVACHPTSRRRQTLHNVWSHQSRARSSSSRVGRFGGGSSRRGSKARINTNGGTKKHQAIQWEMSRFFISAVNATHRTTKDRDSAPNDDPMYGIHVCVHANA